MEDYPGLPGWALNAVSCVLIRGRQIWQTKVRRSPVATETDVRVMQPQAKECRKPPEAGRGKECFCLRASKEEYSSANALISAQWN